MVLWLISEIPPWLAMKPFIFMMGTFASRTMAFSSFRGNPIQRVYDSLISIKDFDMACRHPEISAYIHSCMSAMNEITLQDLGMDVSDLNAIEDSQCMNISINSQFHITAFLIPKGSSLPLHDHPNMTVLSKVICGELQMRSFTVDEHFDSQHSNEPGICAKLEHEGIKTGEDGAWFLSPTGIKKLNFVNCRPISIWCTVYFSWKYSWIYCKINMHCLRRINATIWRAW